jgi:acetyl esterase/lipase
MALHPEMQTLLQALAEMNLPPLFSGPAPEARARLREVVLGGLDPDTLTPVAAIDNATVPGPGGDIPVRIYRPDGSGPVPTVVFFHGGGWVIGDLDTHDEPARRICRDVGAVVVNVDYRMAPETPFPAPFDDCVAATRYVAEHIGDFGGDPARLAVAGDSAGGNLAAAVAVDCRDRGLPLAAQLLIYPACDLAREYPSYEENAEGYFLTRADTREAIAAYTEGTGDRTDPRISPLYTPDLAGLAPAVIAVAEHDPIRDDGVAYAEALERAGTPVVLRRSDGLIHGFIGFTAASPAADAAMGMLTADLADLLSRSRSPQPTA